MSEQELNEKEGGGDGGARPLCNSDMHPDEAHCSMPCAVCDLVLTIINSPTQDKMPAQTSSGPSQPHKPCIQKVSQRLREAESNYKCFDPVLVSIGPYHHGKPEYNATENLKYESARHICRLVSISNVFNKVSELVRQARDCYGDDIKDKLDDFKFASMMFLDGCFILDFISRDDHFDMVGNWCSSTSIRTDLFLLENQLPFLVLQELMRSTKHEEIYWRTAMVSFIDNLVTRSAGGERNMPPSFPFELQQEQQKQPIHLLDLLRTALFSSNIGLHKNMSGSSSIRYVKELKRAGITFKKISGNYGFGNIKFKTDHLVFGKIFLPQIAIRDTTKSMFLNLAAYETCPDASLDYAAISYFCLMNELINHAKDVKELRAKDIIINFLGSDDQVVHLFNEIAKQLIADPNIYGPLKESIEKHLESTLRLFLVSFYNTNFAPWPTMGAMAAALALILAFLQTYYTMHPPV